MDQKGGQAAQTPRPGDFRDPSAGAFAPLPRGLGRPPQPPSPSPNHAPRGPRGPRGAAPPPRSEGGATGKPKEAERQLKKCHKA